MEDHWAQEEGIWKNVTHRSRKFRKHTHTEPLLLSNLFQDIPTAIYSGLLEQGLLPQASLSSKEIPQAPVEERRKVHVCVGEEKSNICKHL